MNEDKLKSYRVGTTWGWEITDRIFIFGWTIPLRILGLFLWLFYVLMFVLSVSSHKLIQALTFFNLIKLYKIIDSYCTY